MMRSIIRWTFLVSLIAGSTRTLAWAGSPPQSLTLEKESALWLVGDSTLHPFTCRTMELKLTSDVEGGGENLRPAALLHGALKQMELTVPVKSLKSKESSLDKNMYKTLHADNFPEIVFHLSRYEMAPSTVSKDSTRITAVGTLRIADAERPVTLQMEAQAEETRLHVQGQYTLLMTDYGIKPPTMMMGAIKVRDPVVIHFDLQLR